MCDLFFMRLTLELVPDRAMQTERGTADHCWLVKDSLTYFSDQYHQLIDSLQNFEKVEHCPPAGECECVFA